MRISDWSSDVCSSDLLEGAGFALPEPIYRLRFDENIPLQSKGDRSATAKPKPQVSKAAERTAGDAAPDAHVAKLVEEERAGTQGGDLLDERRPIERGRVTHRDGQSAGWGKRGTERGERGGSR